VNFSFAVTSEKTVDDVVIVHLTLSGVMTGEDAKAAIAAFNDAIPMGEFELYAHLKELEKYESEARELWTTALREVRGQISGIRMFGARPIIRMVASTIAMMLRIPMTFEP